MLIEPAYSESLNDVAFHKPEQAQTVTHNADFMTEFVVFLFRTQASPIDKFPVILHPIPKENLLKLHQVLTHGTDNTAVAVFHQLLFSLLSNPSQEFLSNQWQEPFLRFLVVRHLTDDQGTFCRVVLIPPNLTRAQWCFRATCAQEIEHRKEDFDGNAYKYVFCPTLVLFVQSEYCLLVHIKWLLCRT
jgi:hypothetical protein